MASVPVYCLCGKPYDPSKFMIQCDACKEWFHGSCVGLYEHQSSDIEKYHCPKCEKMFGPSISKPRTNWHRHDYAEIDADNKAVQTGTPVFIKELKSRHFPSAEEVLIVMRGQQLTLPHLIQNGFDHPILVENTDGLGLMVPSNTFSVEDAVRYIGPTMEVDAIDVTKQDDIRMTLSEFVRYYNSPTRSRVINVISLEFSGTPLSDLVELPYIVTKLCWMHNIWPEKLPEDCPYSKPQVQKYCLIGVRDSYTDFHIDFGGTSVWYHVLRGEKIFYLIRPTQANLALYKRWMASSNRSETFFGDQVDACYRCTVKQGQTLFIPTAWIHAVLTPVDSLVFGGNFLHSLNLPLQLQVYDIEKRIKTPEKYRFPCFETCNWYAAKHILEELNDQNSGDRKPLPYLVLGAKALVSALKSWTQDKDHLKLHKDEIPATVNFAKLIKDLAKEVRHAEKAPLNKKPKLRQLPPRDGRGRGLAKLMVHNTALEEAEAIEPSESKLNIQEGAINLDHHNVPMMITEPVTDEMQKPIKLCISKFGSAAEDNVNSSDNAVTKPNSDLYHTEHKVLPSLLPTESGVHGPQRVSLVTPKVDDSVYDFHDSEDDSLIVDENPPRKNGSRKINDYGRKQGTLKINLSLNGKSPPDGRLETQAPTSYSENEPAPSSPKLGGIEELLLASGYATEELAQGVHETMEEEEKDKDADVTVSIPSEQVVIQAEEHAEPDDPFVVSQSGRASPSTREAIQGMLSMGRAVQFSSAMSTPQSPHTGTQLGILSSMSIIDTMSFTTLRPATMPSTLHEVTKRKRKSKVYAPEISEEEEFLGNCHQDAEFVYPSLEISEEDGPVFKSRGRNNDDEAWNPKARLVPNFPKPDRPVREGVRKEAVESGLAAAAARLAHLPPPKRPYHRRKPAKTNVRPLNKDIEPKPGTSVQDPNLFDPLAPLTPKSLGPFKEKKYKKGFATAKQRLGRILKIHKMLH